ncbi:MAG TPA: hypothetical protein VFL69_08310 [Marmoricola sp.]|nr:hypothetical protein [Marmoricola sp.]
MHLKGRLAAAGATLATVAAASLGMPAAQATTGNSTLPVQDLSASQAEFTEMGGATPLATDRTVQHWHGSFTDPTNGVTYGYNMVGSDPATNTSTTTPTDIYPVDVVFSANDGYALNGTDVADSTVASPLFQPGDYSTTDHAGVDVNSPGGELSAGNTGVQYEDAVMRSQFDKAGTDGYHVDLGQPAVHAPLTLVVPQGKGSAYRTRAGVVYGLVDINWFSSRVQQYLGQQHTDPTHLPIFLTDNVMLSIGSDCCVIGYHGAAKVTGNGSGSTSGNGSQGVQTFAYSAYTTPGTFGATAFIRDIHALSHEIAEWGDDPFVNNTVDPWLTPTAPQYGCTGILETGDPVVGIGFTMPGNSADPDGYYHPEDEVFLPWFAREAPNTTSQPTQSSTDGRYTLLGDLNPYPGFREPATGC